MPGLLSDVLPAVYSGSNRLKRLLGDLVSNPVGSVQQRIGLLNDNAGEFNELTARSTDEAVQSMRSGGGMFPNSPATNKLTQLLADSYQPMGMFIGQGAKTWDQIAAGKAQQMEKAGADPRAIWKETGSWKGPDGMWRQEIPDNESFYRGSKAAGSSYSDDVLMHQKLFDNYKGLGSSRVIESPIHGGSYDAASGSITVGPKDGNSTMLHELQHAIQQREGWARGGNPESSFGLDVADSLKAVRAKIKQLDIDPYAIQNRMSAKYPVDADTMAKYKTWESLREQEDKVLGAMASPYETYKRLAGEAEARATQARMNMNAAQRRNLFPLDSYDVPADQLIVRFGDSPANKLSGLLSK